MTIKSDVKEILSDPIWHDLRAGTFVTAYYNEPYTSKNVWCCMSNGIHDRSKTVYENALLSANVCTTDQRTKVAPTYVHLEVSVLAPRDQWIKSGDILRDEHYTIYIEAKGGRGAFYLPSVWDEEEDWTSYDLITSLKKKARITSYSYDVYKVPTVVINKNGFEYSSYLINEMGRIILDKVVKYYQGFIKYDNSRNIDGDLPYLINDDGIEYEADSYVRIFYDLADYNRLSGARSGAMLGRKYLNMNAKYSLHEWVALAKLAESLSSSLLKQIKNKIMTYNKNGIFSSDKSFENPQAMLVVSDIIDERSAHNFVNLSKKWKVDSFGANWISQALCSLFNRFKWNEISNILLDKYLPILKNYDVNSITQHACSMHGILTIQKTLNNKLISQSDIDTHSVLIEHYEMEQYILDHYYYQREWENGPFRYYLDESWYRTDVTFHVTSVIQMILDTN